MWTLFFWALFTTAVSVWAHKWGRVWWHFAAACTICSPIVGAIVLAMMGRDAAVMEDRARAMRSQGWSTCESCRKLVSDRYPTCSYCGKAR